MLFASLWPSSLILDPVGRKKALPTCGAPFRSRQSEITSGVSLALIGNASGADCGGGAGSRSEAFSIKASDKTYGKPCQRSRVGEWGSDLTGNWIALAGLSDRKSDQLAIESDLPTN